MSFEREKQIAKEQISLQRIVENAYENFTKSMLSTRTKVLLIGGYADQTHAIKAYLSKTKPLLDRRKKLNAEDKKFVTLVEEYASDAEEYVNWVRAEGGEPVWREALVSYCTAFENCVKTIAVVLLLADQHSDVGLKSQVIIPSTELNQARRMISKRWSVVDGDMPKVRSFFESGIRSKKAAKTYYGLHSDVSESDWDVCNAAFQVRNAIVHNLGYMPQTVNLAGLDLHASSSIELDSKSIQKVGMAFGNLIAPFDPVHLSLGF